VLGQGRYRTIVFPAYIAQREPQQQITTTFVIHKEYSPFIYQSTLPSFGGAGPFPAALVPHKAVRKMAGARLNKTIHIVYLPT
jgi:hypothetical protein